MGTYDDQRYAGERAKLQAEINNYNVKSFSFEAYEKSESERLDLANAKAKHIAFLKSQGKNPKKHIN